MPCYTVQETSIEVGKMNAALLADALSDLGFTVVARAHRLSFIGNDGTRGTYRDGQITTTTGGVDETAIKQAYSARLVRHQARRAGFKVVKTADSNRFVLRRG